MEENRILCMIDFSEATPALLSYAARLASAYQAKLWVLHVYFVPSGYQGEVFIPKEALEGYEKQCREDFGKFKKGDDLKDVDLHFEVRHGDLIEEANQLIAQKKISLLLAANRGGGLLVNILGSNTLKLIYHAQCPVLTVPPGLTFQPFRRPLMAIDGEETPRQQLVRFMKMLLPYKPVLDVIHIAGKRDRTFKEMNKKEYSFEGIPHTFYYLWENHVEDGLEHHMAEHANDLIIMIPRHHRFFDRLFQKSITRQVAFHTSVPLLTIHA